MAQNTEAVSYQVEYFAGGKWQSDTRYTDREEAESAAERMLESSRSPTAVRICQERFDPNTNLFNDVIVFRRSRLDDHNASARGAQADAAKQWADRRSCKRAAEALQSKNAGRRTGQKSWGWYVFVAAILLIGAGGALWAVHNLMFTA